MGIFICDKCGRYWRTVCGCTGVYNVEACHGCTASCYRRKLAKGKEHHIRKFLTSPRESNTHVGTEDRSKGFLGKTADFVALVPHLRMAKAISDSADKLRNTSRNITDSIATFQVGLTPPESKRETDLLQHIANLQLGIVDLMQQQADATALMHDIYRQYSSGPKCDGTLNRESPMEEPNSSKHQ